MLKMLLDAQGGTVSTIIEFNICGTDNVFSDRASFLFKFVRNLHKTDMAGIKALHIYLWRFSFVFI